jgi:hypothetical protein
VLLDAVRGLCEERPGERPVRPVLLVDQFEELFTLCPDEEERLAFVRVLLALSTAGPTAAADGPGPAAVVLGLRADFSGQCLDLPELARVFADGLFVLPPMTVAELRESITRPAELAGAGLEPGLVTLLLRDAGVRADARDEAAAASVSPGALPLVSHALRATWQQCAGAVLTVAGYERTGGIRGAVARTAEDVHAALHPAEQRLVRRLLTRLVHVTDGSGATRRRTTRAALLDRPAEAERAALDAFVRARLVTVDRDTVEITHEALLQAWPRLRGWIEADRAGLLIQQQLAHAAEEWEREGRDPFALYRGPRLETVRAWAQDLDAGNALGPREEAFLRASGAAEEGRVRQARRQVRLQQRMLTALVALLVVAVTAGGLAYQQRTAALGQERVARSQALAVRSTSLATGRPEASMLLAGEAYRTAVTPEARGALLSTQAQPFLARLGGHRGPSTASPVPSGTYSNDHRGSRSSARSARELPQPPPPEATGTGTGTRAPAATPSPAPPPVLSGLPGYPRSSPDIPPSACRRIARPMARCNSPEPGTRSSAAGSTSPAACPSRYAVCEDTSARPTGTRSCPYVSSSGAPAQPCSTMASFQARLYASWIPVFSPCPEPGPSTCAASPATKQRPSRIRATVRRRKPSTELQAGSPTRTSRPSPADSFAANRSATGRGSRRAPAAAVSSSRQYPSRAYGTSISGCPPVWIQCTESGARSAPSTGASASSQVSAAAPAGRTSGSSSCLRTTLWRPSQPISQGTS